MKRLHVHISVADLDRSIRSYSTLFAAGPSLAKPRSGVDHLGFQVETAAEPGDGADPGRVASAVACCEAAS